MPNPKGINQYSKGKGAGTVKKAASANVKPNNIAGRKPPRLK